jgi:hypothetical protein
LNGKRWSFSAEAELVEDGRRDRVLLCEQLRDDAVARLAAPVERHDGKALLAQLVCGSNDAPLREIEQIGFRQRRLEPQLRRLEVIDDVHQLEDDAGLDLAATEASRLAGHHEQIADVLRVLEVVGEVEPEVLLEVVHRLGVHEVDPAEVLWVVEVDQVELEEPIDVGATRESHAVPVDDGVALQDEAHDLEIAHVEPLGKERLLERQIEVQEPPRALDESRPLRESKGPETEAFNHSRNRRARQTSGRRSTRPFVRLGDASLPC